jgi:hypothetical protein
MPRQNDAAWFKREQEARAKEAMVHSNVLGAGAGKRKELPADEKVGVVMKEFKRKTLHSGSGDIVKSRRQALAIALNSAGVSKKKNKA